jgi:hypothetical protein
LKELIEVLTQMGCEGSLLDPGISKARRHWGFTVWEGKPMV